MQKIKNELEEGASNKCYVVSFSLYNREQLKEIDSAWRHSDARNRSDFIRTAVEKMIASSNHSRLET